MNSKLQIGTAYLWKQRAFRGLANYEVLPEKADTPNLKVGFGLQGIGTGNPGYFATTEKTFFTKEGAFGAFLGFGWRTNEDHGHLLGGLKWTPLNTPWTLGIQNDGHQTHPFANYRVGNGWSVGAYWVDLKSLGLMVNWGK